MNTSETQNKRSVTTNNKQDLKQQTKRKFPMGLMYTLIALCLCIVWFAPVKYSLSKQLWPTAKKGTRDSYQFISLAYVDSSEGEIKLNTQQLDAHLDALSANGYSPMSLSDAIGLIERGDPVPRKSILLTVDSDSKDTTLDVKDIIRNHGWNAVLFTSTDPIISKNEDALTWQQLKQISDSGKMDIGSMGNVGSQTITTDRTGKTSGNFLTSQKWLEESNRQENLAEFQARVAEDHKTSINLAKDFLKEEPLAYAYPYGDFGQSQHPDDYAGRINITTVSSLYKLAFTLGDMGLNTIFSDATRLNRLEVDPEWTASDLIAAIDSNNRNITKIENTDFTKHNPGWIADWGQISNVEEGIEIAATPQTSGARAWIAGSNLRKNFSTTINFTVNKGDATFYLRAAQDDSAYILLNFEPNGNISISQKDSWKSPIITLASTKAPFRLGKNHKLDIFVRDQYFSALLDGNAIFEQNVKLTGVLESGYIGIGSSAEATGTAKLTVTDAIVQNQRSQLASWALDQNFEPYVMDWVHRNSGRLTELSPPWKSLNDTKTTLSQKDSVYNLLAKIHKLRLTPKINIESETELQLWTPGYVAERAEEYDCDGIYINFENYPNLEVAPLENWLRRTSEMLSGYGRSLLVRLPPMLERLATVNAIIAVIPAVEIVTDNDTRLPLSSKQSPPIQEEEIKKPNDGTANALPVAFAIDEKVGENEEPTIELRIKQLREEAEASFHRGAYEKAIATYSEWHQLEPTTPRPLTRIGDALINLGYHDEATGFYRQSLNMAPGQVDLAVRQARLLTNLNRKEGAKDLLNSYARLFPDNIDILFAQAEWLYKQDRNSEAQKRIERILTLDDTNFAASLFLLRLASDETSRTYAVDKLMTLCTTPDHHYDMVNAVWQYDLLTLPNSHLLVTILNDIDSSSENPDVQSIISKLRPRTDSVIEKFSQTNGLSDAWQIDGATTSISDNKLIFNADPSRSEFTTRLLRSERWRDSYLEANIADIDGGFWLYTRRSRNHLVRFGFDENSDRVYLQAWKGKNNNIVLNQFIPWTKPKGNFKMRLEVRGNGISASIDGKQAFDVPLALPNSFGLGWAAFSVQSRNRGTASVTLSKVSAGPLPVRLALLPAAPATEDSDQELGQLREQLGTITDFSPDWFAIDETGSWNSQSGIDDGFFRLFSRYYRIRLVPTVRVAPGAEVLPEDILTVTRIHNFDGLVLLFDTMPPEEWFHRMDRELGAPGLDLLAVAFDEMSEEASMRGIAASRTLFQGAGTIDDVPVVDCKDETSTSQQNTEERAILLF